MQAILTQPTVNLCYMASNPSNARRARKAALPHLERLSTGRKWAIIELPNFVNPDKVNNPHNMDILHFVYNGEGSIEGEYGNKCKALAEKKGSWLHRALTSNSLYQANGNAAGLYFVLLEGIADDDVLRSVPMNNIEHFQP